MQQLEGDVSNPCLRVVRLSGELLEVPLTRHEANKIVSVRDLKRCLAKNDTMICRIPGSPFLICRIWLIHDTPLQDDHLLEWEWFEQGSLQYVVKDVMSSALEELFPGDLIFCYQDLEELLNPRLLISYICKIWKQRGQAFCEHVFTSWKSAILSLPREVHSSATLHRCLDLLEGLDEAEELMRAEYPETFSKGFYEKRWLVDNLEAFLHKTFASMTIELVRQKVDVETVEQTFHYIDHGEKAKSDLWKLVQGHPRCCSVGLRFGLGADLMMALIEKGLPRCCWAGHSDFYEDNLLQHIMAPEADPLWVRVRDVIRERMQTQVREFQGSLLALVELARSVRSSSGCGLDPLDYLPAFEEQMWQRASIIRDEWLRMGWRFAGREVNAQISEVLTWHYQAVGAGLEGEIA